MKHVIIGNGIAEVCAAEAIRTLDQMADITMIGDEIFPPYSRPMISQILDGSQPYDKLPIRSKRFYEDLKINTLLGQRVVAIDVHGHQVTLADESSVAFDRLLLAAGADPRPVKAVECYSAQLFRIGNTWDSQLINPGCEPFFSLPADAWNIQYAAWSD